VQKQRDDLRDKILAPLPVHYDADEQKAVEQIILALTCVVIPNAWEDGFDPFDHIVKTAAPHIKMHSRNEEAWSEMAADAA
jgi:hypothetical protein